MHINMWMFWMFTLFFDRQRVCICFPVHHHHLHPFEHTGRLCAEKTSVHWNVLWPALNLGHKCLATFPNNTASQQQQSLFSCTSLSPYVAWWKPINTWRCGAFIAIELADTWQLAKDIDLFLFLNKGYNYQVPSEIIIDNYILIWL